MAKTGGPSTEKQALLKELSDARKHIFDDIGGLSDESLRRRVLPSGWTCLGLINHLALDDERFWFQAVIAGDEEVVNDVLASSDSAWDVVQDVSAKTVLDRYRENIERADAIIDSVSLDGAPKWWPDFFGSWRLDSVRAIVLHVISETAIHAGQLDAVRELIDGKQHTVLKE